MMDNKDRKHIKNADIFSNIFFDGRYIKVSDINLNDRCFNFRFFLDPSQFLIDSIKRFGIISPPVLFNQGDYYQILDGFKRIEIARIQGIDEVFALIWKNPVNLLDKVHLALSIFLSTGTPNILDQAIILMRLASLLDKDWIIQNVLPLLGKPPSKKIFERLIPLSEMEEKLGRALLEGKINHDMALCLMEISSKDREQICSLFLYFGYSQSKQFELLTNLYDLSKKEDKSITEILRDLGWEKDKGNRNYKDRVAAGEAFRQRLRARRFPVLTELETAWRRKTKALHLPPTLFLAPPTFFEGNTYKISFTFRDKEGLKERIIELNKLIKRDEWDELFSKKIHDKTIDNRRRLKGESTL